MKPNRLNLKSTQQLLWKLITAPEGVEKALLNWPQVLPICGDNKLSNAERLDIYANMYFFRILDSLKEDFPAVLKILGDDRFHNLVTDYLLRHPPSHWSLRYAGENLPRFLKTHDLLARWPFLADLSQFEWSLLDAFDAPDQEALRKEDLALIKADRWNELCLELTPSFALLRFHWGINKIREGALRGGRLSSTKVEKTTLMIWRKDLKVYYRRVEPLEEKLLRKLLEKATFGELCGLAAEASGAERCSVKVTRYLQRWIRDEIFCRLRHPITIKKG